jgi:hypothetical protein
MLAGIRGRNAPATAGETPALHSLFVADPVLRYDSLNGEEFS